MNLFSRDNPFRVTSWLSPKGRLNRQRMMAFAVITAAIGIVLNPGLYLTVDDIKGSALAKTWTLIHTGVYYYILIMLGAKRLHDMNRSGWFQLWFAAAGVLGGILLVFGYDADHWQTMGLALLIMAGAVIWNLWTMFIKKGTNGPNRFGEDPRAIPLFGPRRPALEQAAP